MMNREMERAGIEQRVDPRSWANQGREDLADLREPKTLGGNGPEAEAVRREIEQLRRQRKELPAQHLDEAAAVQKLEQEANRKIAAIEARRDEELSILDRLIAAAKDMASTAKAVISRTSDRLHDFLAGVDAFEKEAGEELAQKRETELQESLARPREPSREELDRQLREIAQAKARYPDGKIEEVGTREISGRVLGYTSGNEEALFQRIGGGLFRLDMRGKPLLKVGKEIDYDPRSRGISRGGREL